MKRKNYCAIPLLVSFFAVMLALSGCLKDHCSKTYKIYKPIYKTLSQVRAGMKSGAPKDIHATGKIFIYGDYLFLNEPQKGIHVIDNSDPAAPKPISFINIPGNVDMAVRGATLYADSWSDLVTFDISNPKQVQARYFVNNVFPEFARYYVRPNMSINPDSVMVMSDWEVKDTTVSCEAYGVLYETYYASASADANGNYTANKSGGIGMSGSMARFSIVSNYLYTVTSNSLNTFSLANAQQPLLKNNTPIGWNIETIFPFSNKLFIGSATGMFIFDVSDPENPYRQGNFSHVRSCDPVIADNKHAWVTLRSGAACGGVTNQLEVLDIADLSNPTLLKAYQLTNPHGLAKEGDVLILCDGKGGLKFYNAADPMNLQLVKTIDGIDAYDVIAYNKKAIVVGKEGLFQFNYTDVQRVKLLSKINITSAQ